MMKQSVARQLSICSLLVFILVTLSDITKVLLLLHLASLHIESQFLATRLINNCHGSHGLGRARSLGSHLTDDTLGVGLVLEHATDSDRLALVTQREFGHLRHHLKLLESNRVLGRYSADHFTIAPDKLWLISHGLLASIVLLDRLDDVLDDNLVVESMNMHYTGVALGHDRTVLEQLKNVHLSLEDLSHGHHAVSVAEDETALNLIVISNVDSQLHVVTGVRVLHRRVGGINDLEDLSGGTAGHNSELITEVHSTIFDLTVHDEGGLVLHLIKNGNTQGTLGVSRVKLQLVERLNESRALVPVAVVLGHGLIDVLAAETSDGNPKEIILREAGGIKERSEAVLDLIESLLIPLVAVHLVDDDDELLDAEGLGELCVLTSLAVLLETGLELTLTGRDDESANISKGGTHDHVRNIVLVTGSVEHRELLVRSIELSTTHLNGLTLSLLFFTGIHDVSEPP